MKRRRRVAWLLLAVMTSAIAATVAISISMERGARQSMTAALDMARLESDELKLSRAADAALAGSSDDLRGLAQARASFADALSPTTRGLSAGAHQTILAAARGYLAAVDETAARIEAGDRLGAQRLDRSSDTIAFDELRTRVENLAASSRARSTGDERDAELGVALALAIGGLLVVAAGAAGLRLRSQLDLLDGEQTGLRRSEATFRTLVHESTDLLVVTDPAGTIKSVGPSAGALLGIDPAGLTRRALADLIHPDDQSQLAAVFASDSRATGLLRVEWRWRHDDGSWRWFESAVRDLRDHPEVEGWVFNARDVTERHRLEAELRAHALHDPLTGLANRTLFEDRLARALAARTTQRPTLVAIDLDGFKQINDTLGHEAGDRVLVVVADRLLGALRPTDTVARLGGDEFAVLIEGPLDPGEIDRIADRIVDAVGEPIDAEGEPLLVGASVGVARAEAGATAATLTRQADAAMYAAKAAAGRAWRHYDAERDSATVDRRQLHAELRSALPRGEFVLQYQPIVELDTERLAGVEALLRWQRPGHGLVAPDVFIPLAERSGEIIPIGRWVLEQAVVTVRGWQLTHPAHADLYVSVNLSARQLHDPRLVDHTRNVLAATGLAPEKLILELTETLLAVDGDQVANRLGALKNLGVQLAVDDFGTGYSSLSYLRRFPIDIVKIDRSFVQDSESDPRSAALLAGVVTLGESLRLRTLAEGVETNLQAETLRRLNCGLAQGFHFARPLPEADLDQLLAKAGPIDPTASTFPANGSPEPRFGVESPGLLGQATDAATL